MSLYVFASSTNPIPLSALDNNFNTLSNSIGNVSTTVGNLSTTVGNLSTTVGNLSTTVGHLYTRQSTVFSYTFTPSVTIGQNTSYQIFAASGSQLVSVPGWYFMFMHIPFSSSSSGLNSTNGYYQSSSTSFTSIGLFWNSTAGGQSAAREVACPIYITLSDTYAFGVATQGGTGIIFSNVVLTIVG